MEEHRIGIPGSLLGTETGVRIPIQHLAPGLITLDKPDRIAARQDSWFTDTPDIERCVNRQVDQGKPELIHHQILSLRCLNQLEPEATGLLLCVTDRDSGTEWVNLWGSLQFTFHFILVAQPTSQPTEPHRVCQLPIARHFNRQCMVVSHTTGKKALTHFHLLAQSPKATVWMASTRYCRLHQIRLHAAESGIALLRDPLYQDQAPGLSLGAPLQWVHLYAISSDGLLPDQNPLPRAPFNRFWRRMLKRLALDAGQITTDSEALIENCSLPIG